MFFPNRDKVFEDLEAGDECDNLSCHNYMTSTYSGKSTEPVCVANHQGECLRVNMICSEINQFIGDNDDVFMYISSAGA